MREVSLSHCVPIKREGTLSKIRRRRSHTWASFTAGAATDFCECFYELSNNTRGDLAVDDIYVLFRRLYCTMEQRYTVL
jgi:hypothetical protein